MIAFLVDWRQAVSVKGLLSGGLVLVTLISGVFLNAAFAMKEVAAAAGLPVSVFGVANNKLPIVVDGGNVRRQKILYVKPGEYFPNKEKLIGDDLNRIDIRKEEYSFGEHFSRSSKLFIAEDSRGCYDKCKDEVFNVLGFIKANPHKGMQYKIVSKLLNPLIRKKEKDVLGAVKLINLWCGVGSRDNDEFKGEVFKIFTTIIHLFFDVVFSLDKGRSDSKVDPLAYVSLLIDIYNNFDCSRSMQPDCEHKFCILVYWYAMECNDYNLPKGYSIKKVQYLNKIMERRQSDNGVGRSEDVKVEMRRHFLLHFGWAFTQGGENNNNSLDEVIKEYKLYDIDKDIYGVFKGNRNVDFNMKVCCERARILFFINFSKTLDKQKRQSVFTSIKVLNSYKYSDFQIEEQCKTLTCSALLKLLDYAIKDKDKEQLYEYIESLSKLKEYMSDEGMEKYKEAKNFFPISDEQHEVIDVSDSSDSESVVLLSDEGGESTSVAGQLPNCQNSKDALDQFFDKFQEIYNIKNSMNLGVWKVLRDFLDIQKKTGLSKFDDYKMKFPAPLQGEDSWENAAKKANLMISEYKQDADKTICELFKKITGKYSDSCNQKLADSESSDCGRGEEKTNGQVFSDEFNEDELNEDELNEMKCSLETLKGYMWGSEEKDIYRKLLVCVFWYAIKVKDYPFANEYVSLVKKSVPKINEIVKEYAIELDDDQAFNVYLAVLFCKLKENRCEKKFRKAYHYSMLKKLCKDKIDSSLKEAKKYFEGNDFDHALSIYQKICIHQKCKWRIFKEQCRKNYKVKPCWENIWIDHVRCLKEVIKQDWSNPDQTEHLKKALDILLDTRCACYPESSCPDGQSLHGLLQQLPLTYPDDFENYRKKLTLLMDVSSLKEAKKYSEEAKKYFEDGEFDHALSIYQEIWIRQKCKWQTYKEQCRKNYKVNPCWEEIWIDHVRCLKEVIKQYLPSPDQTEHLKKALDLLLDTRCACYPESSWPDGQSLHDLLKQLLLNYPDDFENYREKLTLLMDVSFWIRGYQNRKLKAMSEFKPCGHLKNDR